MILEHFEAPPKQLPSTRISCLFLRPKMGEAV